MSITILNNFTIAAKVYFAAFGVVENMTKDSVLAILAKEKKYISGEEISREIGVSRAAVNAAVKALRAEGHEIDSVTNKGYFLKASPDALSAGLVGAYLDPERMKSVVVLETVDSTNKRLREMAFDGAPDGQVVMANEQTSGRGRRGRNFFSPKDKGIYFSYLIKPDMAPADAVSLTAWTAVATTRAISEVSGFTPGIKWVNDLVSGGRKLCGILTEMSVESETGRIDNIIIGIGININNDASDFPDEIKDIATSIALEAGHSIDRSELAAAMVRELDRMRADWPDNKDSYLEAYRQADITCGRAVNVIQGGSVRPAEALNINDDFSLKVRFSDGQVSDLSSGEVSLKIL